MGGGNGAKAQQKRERNAKKAAGNKSTSQKAANEAAFNKKCALCGAGQKPLHATAGVTVFQQHMEKFHNGDAIEKGFGAYL